jgi:hypothetical protein
VTSQEVVELVRRTTREQGLPERVSDPSVLTILAGLLERPAEEQAEAS